RRLQEQEQPRPRTPPSYE
ncbi:Cytoplasmic protein, partial [Monkeypox virus]